MNILSFIQSLWGALFSKKEEGKLVEKVNEIGNEKANIIMARFKEDHAYDLLITALEEVSDYAKARLYTDDPQKFVEMAYCQAYASFKDFFLGVVEDLSVVNIKERIDEIGDNKPKESEYL
jgi:hypothetical protein